MKTSQSKNKSKQLGTIVPTGQQMQSFEYQLSHRARQENFQRINFTQDQIKQHSQTRRPKGTGITNNREIQNIEFTKVDYLPQRQTPQESMKQCQVNPANIFNPIQNPGHHKANSMQINNQTPHPMTNFQQNMSDELFQNFEVARMNQNNSKNDLKVKQVNITKTHQQKPSQKVMEINNIQRSSNSPSNNMINAKINKKITLKGTAVNERNQGKTFQSNQNQNSKVKNSHILMSNNHVKIKSQFPGGISNNGDSSNPQLNDRINRAPGVMQNNDPANQGQFAVPGHKKSNSQMNQKMMQLLLNKEYGNNHQKNKSIMVPQQMIKSHHIEPSKKSSIQNNHQKLNSQTFHVVNSKNVQNQGMSKQQNQLMINMVIGQSQKQVINPQGHMKNELVTQTDEKNSKTRQQNINIIKIGNQNSTPQTTKQKAALRYNQNSLFVGDNLVKQNKIKSSKESVMSFNKKQGTQSKTNHSTLFQGIDKTKIKGVASSSFDKSGKSSFISKNRNNLGQMSNQVPSIGFNKKHSQQTQMESNSNAYRNISVIGTKAVTSICASTAGITGIPTQLPTHMNTSMRQSNVVSAIGNHNRTKSDANYIMNLGNQNKTNFVISSANHVYQNKKSTNLKAMNNNSSISKHGATKGFLNKVGQASAIKNIGKDGQLSFIQIHPHQQSSMHKKNQYSTIVKSNYKNLVESLSDNNEQDEAFGSQGEYPIDHELFLSNQNKTTEQKYAELKMKYNDLLNKHINLASQKTEDNRSKTISKGNIDDNMMQNQLMNGNYDKLYQQTQKQTIDHKSNSNTGIRQTDSQDNISIDNQNRNINSNLTSKNQSPRSVVRIYEPSIHNNGDQRSLQVGQITQEEYEQFNFNEKEGHMHDPNNVNNILTSFEGLKQNYNILSRMEGQGPLTHAQNPHVDNKNLSDNVIIKDKKNLRSSQKTHASSYGISHKRSVSDELFTKMLPQGTMNQNGQMQQIPLKQNKTRIKAKLQNDMRLYQKIKNDDLIMEESHSHHKQNMDRKMTYSNDENLMTDTIADYMIDQEIIDANEDHHNMIQINQNQAMFVPNHHKNSVDQPQLVRNQPTQDVSNDSLSIQNVVQQQYMQVTDISDRRSIKQHMEGDGNRKKSKKKTKSLMTSIQNQSKERQNKIVPDIDMNSLAKKYKMMRKSGDYHGGLSSDAKQMVQTSKKPGGGLSIVKTQGINMTTKASGQADRFGTDTHNQIDSNAVRAIAHRKVKSGVPEQVSQNNHKITNIISNVNFKQNHPMMMVTPESKMNSSVSGQRSMQSINRSKKPQRDFMLIYEENTNEEGSVGLDTQGLRQNSDEIMLYQSNQQDSRGNKIINVSFNDFNQSLDNANVENSTEQDTEPAKKENLHIQQIQTNNKNVNNFLQALQKIKPANPIQKNIRSPQNKQQVQNQGNNQVQILDHVSPNKPNQRKNRKGNLSEIPTGQLPQARHEKYQKMMMKVKQADQRDKVVHHTRIKSTNEGVSKVVADKHQYNRSTERQWSKERHDVSLGIPSEFEQNPNQKLKITFVGDQALLKKHNQQVHINPGISACSNPVSNQTSCQKPKQIQFHQNPSSNQLQQSQSNSNTDGDPSPVVLTQLVPQSMGQLGETSISPRVNKGQMINHQIKRNNFVNDSSKMPFNEIVEPNVVSDDYEGSQAYSAIEASSHHLMHNLNKGNKYLGGDDHRRATEPGAQQRASDILPYTAPLAPQVSERLITDESANRNGLESPRSKQIRKLIKLVKLSFKQQIDIPQTTIDFYRIGKVLGKGAFGKVNLAVHKLTECLCAVKSINKQFFSDESQSKKVMQEVVMLKRAKHKNIVRLYEYFETEKHLLFVIELCAGGDLLTYVRRRRRLKEDVAKCLFKQIIESLAYCHRKSILHRDIKLDNILLDADGNVKLCDFGVGKIVKKGEKMTEQCGTPAYIAPEILRDQGYYGYSVDIWSAGVVLYAMLYGTVPFKANNMNDLQKMIMKAKYTLREDISVEARDLLKGLMEKDPAKRMTISEVLLHTWLADAQDSRDLELFTEQDKQNIKNEFAYLKSKRYNRNLDSSALGGFIPSEMMNSKSDSCNLDKDMFTEHLLDTTQNSILKNCETKSVILAPFNSTKSNLNLNQTKDEDEEEAPYELPEDIKELIEDRRIIKYGARVRDIDRQYEINNNADLDNGVYHKVDEEEQKLENELNQEDDDEDKSNENKEGTEDQQFKMEDSEIMLDEEEQEILKELKKQGKAKKNKNKKESEMQKLENMIQDQEDQIEENYLMLPDPPRNDGGGNLNTENSYVSPLGQSPMTMSKLHQTDQDSKMQLLNSPILVDNQNNMKIIDNLEHSKEDIRLPSSPSQFIDSKRQGDTFTENDNPFMKHLYLRQHQDESITIEEKIVSVVEEFGYPKEYLLKCLGNHDLNYATTSYLLLHFLKKNNEYRHYMLMKSYDQIVINDQQTPRSKLSQMKAAVNPQNSVCSSTDRRALPYSQIGCQSVPDICS